MRRVREGGAVTREEISTACQKAKLPKTPTSRETPQEASSPFFLPRTNARARIRGWSAAGPHTGPIGESGLSSVRGFGRFNGAI